MILEDLNELLKHPVGTKTGANGEIVYVYDDYIIHLATRFNKQYNKKEKVYVILPKWTGIWVVKNRLTYTIRNNVIHIELKSINDNNAATKIYKLSNINNPFTELNPDGIYDFRLYMKEPNFSNEVKEKFSDFIKEYNL